MKLTKDDKLKLSAPLPKTDNIMEIFAVRLKELREIAGITQAELAELLKVSRGTISYYEKAERTADICFLERAAELFDVSIDYLLGNSANAIDDIDYNELYLTDNAINKLMGNYTLTFTLCKIIESNHFYSIMEEINNFINDSHSLSLDSYREFLITKYFIAIIEEIRANELMYNEKLKKSISVNVDNIFNAIRNNLPKGSLKELDEMFSNEYSIKSKIYKYFENQKDGESNGNDNQKR